MIGQLTFTFNCKLCGVSLFREFNSMKTFGVLGVIICKINLLSHNRKSEKEAHMGHWDIEMVFDIVLYKFVE